MNNLFTRIGSFVILLFCGEIVFSQAQTLGLTIECSDGLQGSQHCFDFVVSDGAIDIEALQFSISYDPKIISFVSAIPGTQLKDLSQMNFSQNLPGTLSFLWFDDAVVLENGDVLFSLCFNFIGAPGECTEISIGQYPTEIDVVSALGPVVLNTTPCTACVLASACTIVSKYCNPTTNSANDGSINFYAVGGTGPYTYSILPSGQTGTIAEREVVSINNLGLGVQTITITDALGCMRVKPVSIADVGQVSFDVRPYFPSCFNRKDGQIKIDNIAVTNIPYSIKWNTGFYEQDSLPNIASGKYFVTVSDFNGCERSEMIDLTVDTLKLNYTILDSAICLGQNARISLDINGGVPFTPGKSYEIRLNNGAPVQIPMPATFPTVPSGTATFIVRDNAKNFLGNANPCTITETIIIPYKNKTKYDTLVYDDIKCKGGKDGHVRVGMSGVGDRYRIIKEWNVTNNAAINPGGGVLGNNTYVNDSLKAGNYYIITESTPERCRDTFKFTITEPINAFTITSTIADASCSGPGSILLTPNGGVNPVTYTWNDVGLGSNNRPTVAPGLYSVTATDNNGCDTILSFEIKEVGVPDADAVVQQAISCKDFTDGQVTVNITANATFRWEDEAGAFKGNSKTISNLSWGTYYVTITSNGCQKLDSVFLANPDGIRITDFEEIKPECPGSDAKGSLGVTVEGGSPQYVYVWRDLNNNVVGGNTSVLASVSPGTYSVRIRDFSNCFVDTTLILNPQIEFEVELTGVIDATCNGLATGQATATASLGPINNGRYSFFWSSGEQSVSANFNRHAALKLSAGENWVIVADNKCKSDTFFFNINEPPAISVGSSISGLCSGSCTGQINLSVSGGSSSNSFKPTVWPTISQTGNTLFNLCAGNYPFTVEDLNGCIFQDTVALIDSDSLSVTLDETLSELLSCKNSVGQLALRVSGGTPDYTYQWANNVSQSNIASNLSQGIYSVTVSDDNNCSATFSYTLNRPNEIVAEIPQPNPPFCFGGKTCLTILNVSGGVGNNYTMQINNGLRIPIDSCYETFAGEYLISIYDADGCKTDYSISIDQPNPVVVDLGEDIELNLGEESPNIESIVLSDEIVLNYLWTGVDSILCLDEICSSIKLEAVSDINLTLTVVDENGCTGNDTKRIFVSDKRNVYIPNIFKTTGSAVNAKFDFKVGFGVEEIEELFIYDRWGNIVFKQENYMPNESTGWDGLIFGQQALPGVYVYMATVSFIDGQKRIYKGDVTLIK